MGRPNCEHDPANAGPPVYGPPTDPATLTDPWSEPMPVLKFHVVGLPAPQGSKRHVGNGVMVESSKKVRPWRQDVAAAAKEAAERASWSAPSGALSVVLHFTLPRPRYHFRTGARASELRPNAPTYVDKKPDADKLARSTLDALTTAGVIRDDAQIARLEVVKQYGDLGSGCLITVSPAEENAA
jgi:Holliday junction resolvase RusA-like endonuclease